MIRIKSTLLASVKTLFQYSLLLATFIVIGFSANAQISATISPQPVGDIEFCVATGSSTSAQNFVITASTTCSTNPNALTYQWYVGTTALASGGGSGYNSGTAATLTVTDLQAMYAAGTISCNDTLYCVVSESASGCADIDTVGGWVFKPVNGVPVISLTADQTVCQGNEATFDLDISGPAGCSGELTIGWTRFDFSGSSKATRTDILSSFVAGVDTSYTFSAGSNGLAADQDSVQVIVSNVCGMDTNSNILTVMPTPNLYTGSNLTFCQGDTVSAQNIQYSVTNAELDAASGGAGVNWTVTTTVLGSDAGTISALQTLMNLPANSTGTGSVTNKTVDLTGATGLMPGTYTILFTTIAKDAGSPLGSPSCPRTLSNQKIDITIYPEPTVEFSTAAVEMCEGETGNSFDVEIKNAEYGSPLSAVNWTYTFNEAGGTIGNSCATGTSGLLSTVSGNGNTTQTISLDGLAAGIYTFKLTGILNSSNTCTGAATGIDSITINVYPNPTAVLSKTAESVCQGDSGAFMVTVSDAQYCSTPGILTDFDWSIAYTDAVASSAIDSVNNPSTTATAMVGTGNGVYNLLSNDGGALAPGAYEFEMASIAATVLVPACSKTLLSNNKYTLTVNPEPTVSAVVSTAEICEGSTGEKITVSVSNAMLSGVGQAWTVAYSQAGRAVTSSNCTGNYDPALIPSPLSGTGNNTLDYTIPSNLAVAVVDGLFTESIADDATASV